MNIQFKSEKFQDFNKRDGFLKDYDSGFWIAANFKIGKVYGKVTFIVDLLKIITNPTWTYSKEKAEIALKKFLSTLNCKRTTKKLNLEFVFENNEFMLLE